jgi:Rrf2 family protein
MFQVSKKSQYGLRALVFLSKKHKDKKPLSIKEIAKAEAIPFDFLEKILLQLEKYKIVRGKRGIGGGYFLAKNPRNISIKEIVGSLEKTIMPVDCSLCGMSKKCVSKNVWGKVGNAINSTLGKIKLADLIK